MKVVLTKKWGIHQKGSEIPILDKAVLKAGFKTGLFEKNKDNKKEVEELLKDEPVEVVETPKGEKIEFVDKKTKEKTQ